MQRVFVRCIIMAVSEKTVLWKKALYIFWDEPEANINPLYIGIIVDMLLELQRKEVQNFYCNT